MARKMKDVSSLSNLYKIRGKAGLIFQKEHQENSIRKPFHVLKRPHFEDTGNFIVRLVNTCSEGSEEWVLCASKPMVAPLSFGRESL